MSSPRPSRIERIVWSIGMAIFSAAGIFAGYMFTMAANQQTDEFFVAAVDNIRSDNATYGTEVLVHEFNRYVTTHPEVTIIEINPASPVDLTNADIVIVNDGERRRYFFTEEPPHGPPSTEQPLLAAEDR